MANPTITVPAVQLTIPDYVAPELVNLQPAITLNTHRGRIGHVLAVGGRWYAYAIAEDYSGQQIERLIGSRAYPTPQDALDALIADYTDSGQLDRLSDR